MRYFVAVDSGGTKTETVLFDETGHILLRDKDLGANAMDIGIVTAQNRMLSILNRVAKSAPTDVSAIYCGIAGTLPAGDALIDFLRSRVKTDSLRIDDDGPCIISSMIAHSDGCCIVCGTGSSLFVRIEGERILHIGGCGYLIDTGGSGFELGREALASIFREDDGRGEKTMMTPLFLKQFGKGPRQSMMEIYQGGRAFIARLAEYVFQARKMGDKIASQIFDDGLRKLSELVWTAKKSFSGSFPVVLNGGIFDFYPEYSEALCALVPKEALLIKATAPPVYGSAVEALWDCGLEETTSFRKRFLLDYGNLTGGKGYR